MNSQNILLIITFLVNFISNYSSENNSYIIILVVYTYRAHLFITRTTLSSIFNLILIFANLWTPISIAATLITDSSLYSLDIFNRLSNCRNHITLKSDNRGTEFRSFQKLVWRWYDARGQKNGDVNNLKSLRASFTFWSKFRASFCEWFAKGLYMIIN